MGILRPTKVPDKWLLVKAYSLQKHLVPGGIFGGMEQGFFYAIVDLRR